MNSLWNEESSFFLMLISYIHNLIYLFQYIKNNHNNFLKKQGPKSLTLYILVATPLKKAVISGGFILKPNTCVIKSLKCYDWIIIFILVVQSSEVWSILI